MDDKIVQELSIVEDVAKGLLLVSNSPSLENALKKLIEMAKEADGRFCLSSKNAVTTVLHLCQSLLTPCYRHLLLSSLRLLRNLCAGEIRNQDEFHDQRGVERVMDIITSIGLNLDSDYEIIRASLQLLGNCSVAGEKHQHNVWGRSFPHLFLRIAGVTSREICDPLCMVIYSCCAGSDEVLTELCSEQGLPILIQILCTASSVGLKEDWLNLLLSRSCVEGSYFSSVFFKLHSCPLVENGHANTHVPDQFVTEQSYLLSILSEILNEQIEHIVARHDFTLAIFGILKSAVVVVDFSIRGTADLPTGSAPIDVLGYCLIILRDICACGSLTGFREEGSKDVVDILVSFGLIEFLLELLRNLEPPTTIRKGMKQDQTNQETTSWFCPYEGFRRDIVAILGNCAYRRRHVQDEIRNKNGILLLLQQCVTDDDNPFLREWGIWCARNLLEGNAENQGVVAELELQGTEDVPELSRIGLRVEIDPATRRAKLVNVP